MPNTRDSAAGAALPTRLDALRGAVEMARECLDNGYSNLDVSQARAHLRLALNFIGMRVLDQDDVVGEPRVAPAAQRSTVDDALLARGTSTIREMCDTFDVTPRTLRFYESKELLLPIRQGRKRLYTYRDRARLTLILRGKRFGFSLEEMRQLLELYDGGRGREEQLARAIEIGRARLAAMEPRFGECPLSGHGPSTALLPTPASVVNGRVRIRPI